MYSRFIAAVKSLNLVMNDVTSMIDVKKQETRSTFYQLSQQLQPSDTTSSFSSFLCHSLSAREMTHDINFVQNTTKPGRLYEIITRKWVALVSLLLLMLRPEILTTIVAEEIGGLVLTTSDPSESSQNMPLIRV